MFRPSYMPLREWSYLCVCMYVYMYVLYAYMYVMCVYTDAHMHIHLPIHIQHDYIHIDAICMYTQRHNMILHTDTTRF
jgi:hypothetical protein